MLGPRIASFLVLSLVSALFSGCDDQEAPQCGSPPWAEVQTFAACVSPSSLEKSFSAASSVAVTGKVLEVGTGPAPVDCSQVSLEQLAGHTSAFPALPASGKSWFTIDGGKSGIYTVSLFRTGGGPPVQVGQELQLLSSYANLEGVNDLVVEIRRAGALLVWFGYRTRQMPAEAAFSRGDVVCASDRSCGTDTYYKLDAAIGDAQGSVPAGGASRIGGFDVFNTQAVLYKETGETCSYGAGGGDIPSDITMTAALVAVP